MGHLWSVNVRGTLGRGNCSLLRAQEEGIWKKQDFLNVSSSGGETGEAPVDMKKGQNLLLPLKSALGSCSCFWKTSRDMIDPEVVGTGWGSPQRSLEARRIRLEQYLLAHDLCISN